MSELQEFSTSCQKWRDGVEMKEISTSSADSPQEILQRLEIEFETEKQVRELQRQTEELPLEQQISRRMLNNLVFDDRYAFGPKHDPFQDCIDAEDVLSGKVVNG